MTSTLPPPPPRAEDRIRSRPGLHRDLWRIRPGVPVLVAVALGGLAFDLGVRNPIGAMSFTAVIVTVIACVVGGWTRGRISSILLGLALLPAAFLMVRSSAWLVPLNVLAVVGLLLLAAAVRPEPSAVGRAVGRLLRPIPAIEPAVSSVDLLVRSTRAAVSGRNVLGPRLFQILKGVLVGAPIAIALLALLAASDALFRSWIQVPLDITSIVEHGLVAGFGIALMAGLAGHGAWAPIRPSLPARELLGPTEATIVLAGMVTIYLGFVVAQVVAIAGGSSYVERTTGLTYAEYAREGFFQLLAAALLTLVVLVLLARHRRHAGPQLATRLVLMEQATVVLTLAVVAVAIRRLFLYEAEFGLTMLRLYTIVFASFIGLVFAIVGLTLAGRLRRSPVTPVLGAALAVLLMMNTINPERVVAERNIERFGGTDDLDVQYLVDELGLDALPAVLADPAAAVAVCRRAPVIDDRTITFNLGRHRAADAVARACD